MCVPDHTLGRDDAPNFVPALNFAPSSVMLGFDFHKSVILDCDVTWCCDCDRDVGEV